MFYGGCPIDCGIVTAHSHAQEELERGQPYPLGTVDWFTRQPKRGKKPMALDECDRKDLDETRRLLYIALAGRYSDRHGVPTLIGTLVNALAHHNAALDATETMARLVAVVNGDDPDADQWVDEQISRITSELNESDLTPDL